VVGGLAKIFAVQPQNEAEHERVLKAASACVAWESSASRLNRDESSQSQPDQKYALMAARIHCRPVKQAVSADKGMILHAILAN
jgi:hypothetical protein